MAIEITDENFKEIVLQSDKPVLVDFKAGWCAPCRTLSPIIDEISKEYEDRAIVVKMDVDDSVDITNEYQIRNIPTVLIFKNGEVVDRKSGVSTKKVYSEMIDSLL